MLTAATTPPRFATLVALTALTTLTLNMFLPSLSGMARHFGVDYAAISFAISGYLAVTAGLQLIIGPLSDRFGRRPVILVSLAIFLAASLVCATTDDVEIFLAFRLLQGAIVAGWGISLSVVRDTFGPRDAASRLGFLSMAMSVMPMTGPLVGGNLSLVSALAGTPYAADWRGGILFIEEVNEEPYRIDRWMTQLDLAGGFQHAAALMIGICDNCGPQGDGPSLTLDETFDVHLKPLHVPAVTGYSFGHIRNQFTLPLGIRATLDTGAQTLTLLEPAVA